MTRATARAELIRTLTRTLEILGGDVKTVARDKKEPGRLAKLKFERSLSELVQSRFDRQARWVREKLKLYYADRASKVITAPPITWLDDPEFWEYPEFEADLIILIKDAARAGVSLFEQDIAVGIDYTLVNNRAVTWAREYAYDLVKGIDATTRDVLQNAISTFAETPGMTIGQVMDMLPFNEVRSQMVATTEITRSFAHGQMLAGQELKDENPDLRVTKTWFTNNDDRVCDICGPLDGKEVDLDAEFAPGIDEPPGHVNCRCWISTGTRINTNL